MENTFKGTKGKWIYTGNEIIYDADGYAVIPSGNVNVQEREYNFKLASKAPELLDILEKLVNHYEDILKGDYSPMALRSEIDSTKELIKSATEL